MSKNMNNFIKTGPANATKDGHVAKRTGGPRA